MNRRTLYDLRQKRDKGALGERPVPSVRRARFGQNLDQGASLALQQYAARASYLGHLSAQHAIDLERKAAVDDLVFPEHPESKFMMWLGASWATGRPAHFKCYLNPQVSGSRHAARLAGLVLERSGHGKAWEVVMRRLDGHEVAFLRPESLT